MKETKYGHQCWLLGMAGDTKDGDTEFFVPIDMDYWSYWFPVKVNEKLIRGGKLQVKVFNRDADEEHTVIILPDERCTLMTVHDVNIKMRQVRSFFDYILGKRIKRSELE